MTPIRYLKSQVNLKAKRFHLVWLSLSLLVLQSGCTWDFGGDKDDTWENTDWNTRDGVSGSGGTESGWAGNDTNDSTPAPGSFTVAYRSSVEVGWLSGGLSGLTERDLFKLAEHSVELTINPSIGTSVVSIDMRIDDELVSRGVALDAGVDELVTGVLPLETRHLEEGIHTISYRVLQQNGGALEAQEEIRVLLNVTRVAAEDSQVLWIGTFEYGVAAYDLGADPTNPSDDRWMPYGARQVGLTAEDTRSSYDNDPTAPGGYATMSLAVDSVGGLWIGTFNGGLTYLDHGDTPFDRSDDRYAYFLPSETKDFDGEDWMEDAFSMFNFNSVTSIVPDDEHGVWLGTFDGLFYLDHGGSPLDTSDDVWTHFPFEGRYDRNIAQIAVDERGLVWLASYDLKDSESDSNTLTVLNPRGTPADLSDDRWGRFDVLVGALPSKVFTMTLDEQGLVWIGSVDGMFVLDTNNTPFNPDDDAFARRGVESGLPVDDIGAILPRDDGTVWVGSFELCGETGGGLTLLDFAGATYGNESAEDDVAMSVCDQGGTLERRHCGALTPDADEFVVDYTRDDGLIDSDVSSIVELDSRTVAVGTFNLLSAPALAELISLLTDSDFDGSICEPVVGPEGNPDLRDQPVNVGSDGLSIIYLGDDLRDKSDDVVINL